MERAPPWRHANRSGTATAGSAIDPSCGVVSVSKGPIILAGVPCRASPVHPTSACERRGRLAVACFGTVLVLAGVVFSSDWRNEVLAPDR